MCSMDRNMVLLLFNNMIWRFVHICELEQTSMIIFFTLRFYSRPCLLIWVSLQQSCILFWMLQLFAQLYHCFIFHLFHYFTERFHHFHQFKKSDIQFLIIFLFIGGAGPSGYSPTSPTYSPTSPSYDTEEQGEQDGKKKVKGKSKSSKKK